MSKSQKKCQKYQYWGVKTPKMAIFIFIFSENSLTAEVIKIFIFRPRNTRKFRQNLRLFRVFRVFRG